MDAAPSIKRSYKAEISPRWLSGELSILRWTSTALGGGAFGQARLEGDRAERAWIVQSMKQGTRMVLFDWTIC